MTLTRPVKIAILLFLIPTLIFSLAIPILINPLTRYVLESKLDTVNLYLANRAQSLNDMILDQVAQINYECQASDMSLIRDSKYYNRFIRMIAVVNKDGRSCSTVGFPLQLSDELKAYNLSSGFYMSTTPALFDTEKELLIYYQKEGNRIFWILDSSWQEEILKGDCINCFLLNFHYLSPSLNGLRMSRGNKEIAYQDHITTISYTIKEFDIQETLSAGKEFNQYLHYQLIHWGYPIALAIGILLSIFYLKFRNYRNSIQGLIFKGIKDKQFIPYYQAILDSREERVVGYEILVRWCKGKEMVPPNEFVGPAETSGLIIQITNQIIRKVIDDLEQFDVQQWVSINIVPAHIESGGLAETLEELNWPTTKQIHFEITERTPFINIENAGRALSHLMAKGYKFKIDDFGTGYGGYSYIQNLGISCIKIDKMFIDTIGTDDLKIKVLNSIILSAQEANIEIIAEGVERGDQVDYLATRAVYLIQGFIYSKPSPIEHILQN
ncbi:EAL domain-containing protein [Vibrio anguillarum]|uniref:EAL domain-containing protein n=1 Tax=Vibrio anguillarum TaxID=55601 RepID=UPI00188A4B0F|nr:EAL domain-containing protein [Vibrio anguillarum]MBF4278652.1 EAL domain-containing protein [Vibrio anguillarum]MBF4363904.1 EAL domain-containing protein [Vibrio anguillarum]